MTATIPSVAALQEPNEIGRFTAWDLDFRQISPGCGQTLVSVRQGQIVSTLWLKMRGRVHQVGSAPGGTLTFGLPERESLTSWARSSVPPQPLVCFGAGHEFDGVSQAGFAAHTVSIGRAEFEQLASDFGLDTSADIGQPSVFDLQSRPKAAAHLRRKLAEFSCRMSNDATLEEEEELGLALLLVKTQAESTWVADSSRMRDRVLRHALEIMDARADAPPSMRELCVLCGTSLPTLERSFRERFDMGPKAYLTALRMNRVRQDLLARTHGNRVVDAANRWGFWHMGQFAKDYRKIFNCRPSDDLNRTI